MEKEELEKATTLVKKYGFVVAMDYEVKEKIEK
jgi:hypothetical protein